jgi:hypothetical protein
MVNRKPLVRYLTAFLVAFSLFMLLGTSYASASTMFAGNNSQVFAATTTQSVFLSPKSQSASPGSEAALSVEVKPSGWGVSAGEITIAFDARFLEAIDIKPGNLLGSNPLVGTKTIDNEKGTLMYTLARVGSTSKGSDIQATFASMTFKVKPGATGVSSIKLTKVGLSDENFKDIQGLSPDEATVNITQSGTSPSSASKPSAAPSQTQQKSTAAVSSDKILLDTNIKLLETIDVNNSIRYLVQYSNLLPFASGIEVYSDSGLRISGESNVRPIFKTLAWKNAARQISASDVNTLQEILQVSTQINQTVAPLRSATSSIVERINDLKGASVNVPIIGRKSVWDAAVAAYPQLSSLQSAVESLNSDLNDWDKAAQSASKDLPSVISGLQSVQANGQVPPELTSVIERSMSSFTTMESLTSKVSKKLSDVGSILSSAQSSLNKAASTPYVGGYIGSFADYVGDLKRKVDSVKTSAQSFSSKLSTQSSKLKTVVDSASENENNLYSSWASRQGASAKVNGVVFGLLGLLVALEIVFLFLKRKKMGITFFALLMVLVIAIIISYFSGPSNLTEIISVQASSSQAMNTPTSALKPNTLSGTTTPPTITSKIVTPTLPLPTTTSPKTNLPVTEVGWI